MATVTQPTDQELVRDYKHVGFTGTRGGLTRPQVRTLRGQYMGFLLHYYGKVILHHGDAVGADKQAVQIAHDLSIPTVAYPALVDQYQRANTTDNIITHPPQPPLERNKQIVDSVSIMLACPRGLERLRSGTWSTVRYARNVKKLPLGIILPSGFIEWENT